MDSRVKISKCHRFFNFWQIAKKYVIFLYCLIYRKVWFRSDKNCSSVLNCSAPYGPVLTKCSKCHKMFPFGEYRQNIYNLIFPLSYSLAHEIIPFCLSRRTLVFTISIGFTKDPQYLWSLR